MRPQHIIEDFHSVGILAAGAWTASAVLSLVASLFVYCDLMSDATDEHALLLALFGALGLGFAMGSYAIAGALGKIAIGLANEIASENARRKYLGHLEE